MLTDVMFCRGPRLCMLRACFSEQVARVLLPPSAGASVWWSFRLGHVGHRLQVTDCSGALGRALFASTPSAVYACLVDGSGAASLRPCRQGDH